MDPRTIYEPNSRDTSRYTLPPFQRTMIQLVGDRSRGQPFDSVEGEFLYVDKCDFPCSISLVTPDGVADYMVREGLEIRAPFRGLILFHGAIEPTVLVQIPKLVFYTSKLANFTNTLNEPVIRGTIPYRRAEVNGVGGSRTDFFPVPPGARFIERLTIAGRFQCAASINFLAAGLEVRDQFDNIIRAPDYTQGQQSQYDRQPITGDYLIADTGMTNPYALMASPTGTDVIYRFEFMRRIPLPTDAEYFRVRILDPFSVTNFTNWEIEGPGTSNWGAMAYLS